LADLPTIEEIAAEHVKGIRAVQPEGPYRLGGFCNGALLAHEMALQLQVQNERVDLLVMIDAMEPIPRRSLTRTYRLLRRLGALLQARSGRSLHWFLLLCYLKRYVKHAAASIRKPHYRRVVAQQRNEEAVELLHLVYPRLFKAVPPFAELRKQFEDVFSWIVCEYRPRNVYSGKIAFLWNSEEPEQSFRRNLWNVMVQEKDPGDVMIGIMDGSHNSCKTEHLPDMAKHLNACLRWVHRSS
jgi:hypothetical protein